jgi:hypothetical protein
MPQPRALNASSLMGSKFYAPQGFFAQGKATSLQPVMLQPAVRAAGSAGSPSLG